MTPKITKAFAWEVLDSRGTPTVRCRVSLSNGRSAVATAPSGASTGDKEAIELRDDDPNRYDEKGVLQAVENVNTTLNDIVSGMPISTVAELAAIDGAMIEADGTDNKGNLGANAILSVSLAAAHCLPLASPDAGPLYKQLALESQPGAGVRLPCPMMNILNGGAHADNELLDIQEFMIVPHGAPCFKEALRWGKAISDALKDCLKKARKSCAPAKKGNYTTGVGDEGGFAPNITMREALEMIMGAIEGAGLKPHEQVSIAFDCAMSELTLDTPEGDEFEYELCLDKNIERQRYSAEEIVDCFVRLKKEFPIVSIEDICDEDDMDGWRHATETLGDGTQLVADDLTCTQEALIQKCIDGGAANSLLVKVNQVGSVTEAMASVELAHANSWTTVMSHRSGETGDTTIADLSVATGGGQIKTGGLCRSDRVEKYNRLLEIEAGAR